MKYHPLQRRENSLRIGVLETWSHSSFNPAYQATDILISLVATWSSRLKMDTILKNGTLITRPRPLNPIRIRHGLGKSKMLEDQPICKLGQPTQDGSRFSNGMQKKVLSTMFTTINALMLQVVEMKKETMFKSTKQTVVQPRNGS